LIELYQRTGSRENQAAELKELMELLFERGESDEAMQAYRQLVALRPDDTQLVQRFIELFAQVGTELEIVDEYVRLADLFARRGLFVEATRTYERVLAIDRRMTGVRERFITFLKNCGQKTRALAEMVRLGDYFSESGDHTAALRTFSDASVLDPGNLDAAVGLARSQAATGDGPAAAQTIEDILKRAADLPPEDAVPLYRKLLEFAPDHMAVCERLVDQLLAAGERLEAGNFAHRLAELAAQSADIEKAARALRLAEQCAPTELNQLQLRANSSERHPALRYLDLVEAGDRLAGEGDVDRALAAYRAARGIDDSRPELIQKCIDALGQIAPEIEAIPDYLVLAQRYADAGEPARALEIYNHVLLLDAANAVALAGAAEAEMHVQAGAGAPDTEENRPSADEAGSRKKPKGSRKKK
jgi:tetratricopeptide (TPR) repeat protein